LRPRLGPRIELLPPLTMSRARDPAKEANRNQKKAVLAWSSWHRLPVLCEPLVRLFVVVYACTFVRRLAKVGAQDDIYLIAAAMDSELSSQNHTSDECEDHRQCIQRYQNYVRLLHPRCRKAKQQDYPREYRDEYGIIDARLISSEGRCNDVSDQSCNEKCPEELGSPQAELGLLDHSGGVAEF
jgi:hypothetical protein